MKHAPPGVQGEGPGAGNRDAGGVPGLSDIAEGVVHLQEELSRDVLQPQQVLSKHSSSD